MSGRGNLVARAPVGGGLSRVTIEVPPEVSRTYLHAGQYVEVAVGASRGYFALASPVGGRAWELLVKSSGGASEALLASSIGDGVDVSDALGTGFGDEAARAEHLAIVAAGSAIAVVPPLLAQRSARMGGTHLYVGVRTPADAPLREDLVAWARAGAAVTVCASQGAALAPPELRVVEGRAQSALVRDLPQLARPLAVVAAGPDGLVADLRALAGGDLWVYTNV